MKVRFFIRKDHYKQGKLAWTDFSHVSGNSALGQFNALRPSAREYEFQASLGLVFSEAPNLDAALLSGEVHILRTKHFLFSAGDELND